jgi:putative transposase
MLVQKRLVKFLAVAQNRSETWTHKDGLKQSEQTQTKENMTLTNTCLETYLKNLKSHLNVSKFVTAEFHQEVKQMISKDKSFTCKKNIQPTLLSKILVQDSTLKEKVFKPFWNQHIKDMSKKLWLPTKTDCVDLDSNLSNQFLNTQVMQKSWFSTKSYIPQKKSCQETSYKFSQSLVPDSMVLENTKLISEKIQIYPNKNQRFYLKHYIGIYRKVYNLTVDHISNIPRQLEYKKLKNGAYIKDDKNNYIHVGQGYGDYKMCQTFIPQLYKDKSGKEKKKNLTSFQTLRKNVVIPEWIKNLVDKHDMNKHVCFQRPIDECSKAQTSLYKKMESSGKLDKLSFKSRNKNVIETISLEVSSFSKKHWNRLFPSQIKEKIKASKNFIKPYHDCKLQYNRKTKKWFLIIVKDSKEKVVVQPNDICSIDPGEVSFLTVYSPDNGGHVVEICKNNRTSSLTSHLKRADYLTSKISNTKKKYKTSSMKKAVQRALDKVKDMRNDMHHKASTFLCKNYKHIVIPKYESQPMLSKLSSNVCRSMSNLSFYLFRKRLEYKTNLYNCKLYIVDENHTSKTCGNCGCLNIPKQDRSYNCKSCNVFIDRDFNGSRNILLKHL